MRTAKKTITAKSKSSFDDRCQINVANFVETKGKQDLDYLSWARAVKLLFENDPTASWDFKTWNENGDYFSLCPDGRALVEVTVTAFNKTERATNPITDYSNQPIANFSASDLHNTLQRTLTKAIAMHGIGLTLYYKDETNYNPKIITKIEQAKSRDDLLEIWHAIPVRERGYYQDALSARKDALSVPKQPKKATNEAA